MNKVELEIEIMYCKHCGREIDDNSSFCKYCGKSQDNTNNTLTNKPIWIIYLIWAVSNLYLLMGEKDSCASDYFFPCIFYDSDMQWNKTYYDFSEFITYVFLLPFVCYMIYKVYRMHSDKIDNIIRKLLKK